MSGRRHFQMPTPPGVSDFHSAGAEAAGLWETHRPDERLVSTHCAFCGVQCGMPLRVSEGDVIGVEPRMDTHNRGKLCPKGVGAYQQISHPDRLTFPLVRDGDGLRRASWDEALDRVVAAIRRIQAAHGRDAVATYGGASTITEKTYVLGKFARLALGTRHADYNGRMCMVSAATANNASFGVDRTPNPISDMAHADTAIVLGANVGETFPIFIRHYWELVDRGGTLIVVDPRETSLARVAAMHLALRPGTDGPLLLALLHEIIERDLVDHDFVERHTVGFNEVAASVAGWTAERAAATCGVPARDITEAAVRYGTAERAMVNHARGMEHQVMGSRNAMAAINLCWPPATSVGQAPATGPSWGRATARAAGSTARSAISSLGSAASRIPRRALMSRRSGASTPTTSPARARRSSSNSI